MLNASGAPRVGCVIVHWNNGPDTAACLESLGRQAYSHLHVVVVDNSSSDGSVAELRRRFPDLDLIQNDHNAGFPKACNLGARRVLAAGAEYVWLLNNDTVVPPDTCTKLVRAAQNAPNAGVIGSVLHMMHASGTLQAWGGGVVSRTTGYSRHYTRPFPLGRSAYLTFASVLIPRAVFEQLGGLYEGAFMYFEDSDFCIRAQAAGYSLAVADDTAILHREGGSLKGKSPRLDRIVTTSGLHFLQRHSPFPPVSYVLFLASRLLRRALRLDWPAAHAVLSGARDWRTGRKTPPVD